MIFDLYYLKYMLPALIIAMYAQHKVQSTYARYSQIGSRGGFTGADLVREMCYKLGMNIGINAVPGKLTDHYDPRNQTLNLSEEIYNGRSLAALGVAAHEMGHAIQHARGYAPLALRNSIVPAAQFSSQLAFYLILAGFLFRSFSFLLNVGIILFSVSVLFTLITLPVEFNASRRAIKILSEGGYLTSDELPGAKKVLNAAALTYLAAALAAIMQLLYFISLSQRRR